MSPVQIKLLPKLKLNIPKIKNHLKCNTKSVSIISIYVKTTCFIVDLLTIFLLLNQTAGALFTVDSYLIEKINLARR